MNQYLPPEFDLENYSYELPEERIAQTPAQKRDESRLLVLNSQNGRIQETVFNNLGTYLPPGALLVANNTSVIPARLFGQKKSGGKIQFLLLTPLPLLEVQAQKNGSSTARAKGLLRASKAPKQGDILDFGTKLKINVLARHDFGQYDVMLIWQGELGDIFSSQGEMPLPPYIRRPQCLEDAVRYQTTFCRVEKNGSVAAPTAGLHFTPQLRESLQKQGFSWAEITLYVRHVFAGAGPRHPSTRHARGICGNYSGMRKGGSHGQGTGPAYCGHWHNQRAGSGRHVRPRTGNPCRQRLDRYFHQARLPVPGCRASADQFSSPSLFPAYPGFNSGGQGKYQSRVYLRP